MLAEVGADDAQVKYFLNVEFGFGSEESYEKF